MLPSDVNADPLALGARIKELRARKGWTLDQLSQDLGVSKGFLSQLENGKANPSGATLLKLSQCLETSVDFLLKGPSAGHQPSQPALPAIPNELMSLAAERGWTVPLVIGLVRAQQAVVAHRSGRARGPFTRQEWLEFWEKVGLYLDDGESR